MVKRCTLCIGDVHCSVISVVGEGGGIIRVLQIQFSIFLFFFQFC